VAGDYGVDVGFPFKVFLTLGLDDRPAVDWVGRNEFIVDAPGESCFEAAEFLLDGGAADRFGSVFLILLQLVRRQDHHSLVVAEKLADALQPEVGVVEAIP